jgi:hypothetical protein
MRSPEAVRRDYVHAWLAKADDDLHAARLLQEQETVLSWTVAFHAQLHHTSANRSGTD